MEPIELTVAAQATPTAWIVGLCFAVKAVCRFSGIQTYRLFRRRGPNFKLRLFQPQWSRQQTGSAGPRCWSGQQPSHRLQGINPPPGARSDGANVVGRLGYLGKVLQQARGWNRSIPNSDPHFME